MSDSSIVTPSAGNPPNFTKASRCTDGGTHVWGYFSHEAVDGRFYAWRADGTLIGEFPTMADATEPMIIGGRTP